MAQPVYDVGEDDTVVVRLHVQPGAGRSAVVGRHGDALKVRVAAPPEGGRANEACSGLLAEAFGLKPAGVALVAGATSATKRFVISGVAAEEARRVLDVLLGTGDDGPLGSDIGQRRPR